jgi:hypothetical protein
VEDELLAQQAEQFQREEEAQAEAIHLEQEERDRVEAATYDQACAAENAARIAQEAAAQAQAEAVAQAQAQAAQAAAQAGQLDQYLEALRQQNLPSGRKAYQEPLGRHSLGPMNVEC